MNLKSKLEHIKTGLMALTGAGIYYICDGIFNLIGLPSYPMLPTSPYINEELSEFGGLSYTGGDIMLDQARLNFLLAFKDPLDYKNAESILKKRITIFNNLMTLVESEHSEVARLKFQKRSALKFSSRAIPGSKSRGTRNVSGIIP